MFIDWKQVSKLFRYTNFAVTTNGEKINWRDIKAIQVSCNKPHCFMIKKSHENGVDFQTIKIRSRRNLRNFVELSALLCAHPCKLAINVAKKKDLLAMCSSGIIPERYHDF